MVKLSQGDFLSGFIKTFIRDSRRFIEERGAGRDLLMANFMRQNPSPDAPPPEVMAHDQETIGLYTATMVSRLKDISAGLKAMDLVTESRDVDDFLAQLAERPGPQFIYNETRELDNKLKDVLKLI